MSAFTSGTLCLIGGLLIGLALGVFRSPSATEARLASANALVGSLQVERADHLRQLSAQVSSLINCRTEVAQLKELSVLNSLAEAAR